jgi:hypothetical protein
MEIAAGLAVRTGGWPASSLLIGIGNPLRGDDGVGPWLVETWGRRRARRGEVRGAQRGEGGELLARLQMRVVDQLLPELAEELATVRRVLFVDAWRVSLGARPLGSGPRLLPVAAADRRAGSEAAWGSTPGWTPGHHLGPAGLLQLSECLYGRAPAADSLLIPATAFAASDPDAGPARFSAGLRLQLPRAWQLLDHWLESPCTNWP